MYTLALFYDLCYHEITLILYMAKEIERQYVINTEHPEWIKLKVTLPKKRYIQSTIHRGDGNKLRVRLIEDTQT